jgi:hypothetical protein
LKEYQYQFVDPEEQEQIKQKVTDEPKPVHRKKRQDTYLAKNQINLADLTRAKGFNVDECLDEIVFHGSIE